MSLVTEATLAAARFDVEVLAATYTATPELMDADDRDYIERRYPQLRLPGPLPGTRYRAYGVLFTYGTRNAQGFGFARGCFADMGDAIGAGQVGAWLRHDETAPIGAVRAVADIGRECLVIMDLDGSAGAERVAAVARARGEPELSVGKTRGQIDEGPEGRTLRRGRFTEVSVVAHGNMPGAKLWAVVPVVTSEHEPAQARMLGLAHDLLNPYRRFAPAELEAIEQEVRGLEADTPATMQQRREAVERVEQRVSQHRDCASQRGLCEFDARSAIVDSLEREKLEASYEWYRSLLGPGEAFRAFIDRELEKRHGH